MNNGHEPKQILILDDSSDYRKLLLKHLGNMFEGAEIAEYDPISQGAPGDDFDWSKYDVLVLDYQLNLPGITGLDIFQKNKKKDSFPATIMLTGAGTEELALKALDFGIYTYLDKQKLGKDVLKSSIIEAFNKNKKTRERMLEQTNHSEAFNKSLFYKKLENPFKGVSDVEKRMLMLAQLDLHEHLEEKFGALIRDNIIRHIAKKIFELFIRKKYHPSITRLGEATIALITDSPAGTNELNSLLLEICTDLENNQYKYKDKDFNYKISMGALRLSRKKIPADIQIKKAMDALANASKMEENSFYVAPEAAAETAATEHAEIPEQVREKEEIKPHGSDELILDDTRLDISGLKIKQAIDDKRLVQTYRPIITLISDETEQEAFFLSALLIDKTGTTISADEVRNDIKTPKMQKYFDRWMLREALGRIINNEDKHNYFFIMQLSESSLADTTLFQWLRRLLTGIEGKHPGKSIALEISAHDFFNLKKQSEALMSYLHKSHGFRFVLGALTDIQEINELPRDSGFELLRTDKELIKEMNETLPVGQKQGTILKYLKSQDLKFIVDGINDSTSLTDAIVVGADYAFGDFIGTETEQLDENKFVESFEIT